MTSPGIRSRLRYLASASASTPSGSTRGTPRRWRTRATTSSDYRDDRAAVRHAGRRRGAACAEAHALGLRVLLDIVPNHTSDQHPWFQAALRPGPGSPERDRYFVPARPGRRRRAAAERLAERLRRARLDPGHRARRLSGDWYLHLFAPEQPDLELGPPRRARRLRGDPALLVRPRGRRLPDRRRARAGQGSRGCRTSPTWTPGSPSRSTGSCRAAVATHPHWDRDEVHEIYREWRGIADAYDPPRVFVAEAWVDEPGAAGRATSGPTSCTRRSTSTTCRRRGTRRHLRTSSTRRWTSTRRWVRPPPGCCPTTTSPGTCPATPATRRRPGSSLEHLLGQPADLDLGAAGPAPPLLLTLALPGGRLRLPGRGARPARGRGPPGGRARRTRPGSGPATPTVAVTAAACRCRGPATAPPYGFSPDAATAEPWLPQPDDWAGLTVEAQTGDAGLDAGAVPGRAALCGARAPGPRRRATWAGWTSRRACSASPGLGVRLRRERVRGACRAAGGVRRPPDQRRAGRRRPPGGHFGLVRPPLTSLESHRSQRRPESPGTRRCRVCESCPDLGQWVTSPRLRRGSCAAPALCSRRL